MLYNCQNAILFITFIKFDTAFQVVDSIAEVKPKRLYIASDGGRTEAEHQQIQDFRKLILKKVNWECQIFTRFEEKNQGCKYGPYNAITWFFQNEEQGIILEDDCLPNVSFYRFCDELLEKYKNEERIYLISGMNFCEDYTTTLEYSYLFSKLAHTNGWATWSRAWKNVAMEYKDAQVDFYKFEDLFMNTKEKKYWFSIFEKWKNEGFSSAWDYQWTLHIYAKHGLCITSKHNLIRNIGLNHRDATHPIHSDYFLKLEATTMDFPLKHPYQINRDQRFELEDFKKAYAQKHIFIRVINKISRIIFKKNLFKV